MTNSFTRDPSLRVVNFPVRPGLLSPANHDGGRPAHKQGYQGYHENLERQKMHSGVFFHLRPRLARIAVDAVCVVWWLTLFVIGVLAFSLPPIIFVWLTLL